MADSKKTEAQNNGEFKISPLGFDKAEVMAYIGQHNKEKKALKEENDQLKRELEQAQNQGPSEDVMAEVEKKKAELDTQILESRKQILDERRKLAQTEKQLHVLQDQYKALTEEYTEYKKRADAKLKKAKKSGGAASIDEAQLAEISAKANADANAVIADAKAKADEIITAAKAYFTDTVQKTYDYKQTVLTKADRYTADFKAGNGAIAATVDVFELLSAVAQEINDAVNSAIDSASEKAKQAPEVSSEVAEAKLAEDEAIVAARSELEKIEGLSEGDLDSYKAMEVAPYDFALKVNLPEVVAEDDDEDEEDDFPIADENGLLSSFAVVSSGDDMMSSGDDMSSSFTEEAVVEDDISDLLASAPAPAKKAAPAVKADDDISDLLATPANDDISDLLTAAPAADDLSDLLTEAPAPAPAKKAAPAKEEKPADDFSDLLTLVPDSDDISDLMATSPEPKAKDDFSDLLAGEPAPAPAKKSAPKVEAAADDDLSALFTDEQPAPAPAPAEEPKFKRAHEREGYGSNGEKLNESRAMGVAGKEELPNDPWKDLEAQMNGLSIKPAPKKAPVDDDDDGMTSSFDDEPVEQTSAKDEMIDMSDYSGMLGINDNMNASAAQFDSSWELKMMEGITSDDEDDDMSSDTGFFDL